MNFLKKRFAKKKTETPRSDASEKIKVYDKYGREILISKQEWLDNVLVGNLKKHWNDADELYNLILNAFHDEFFEEVRDACQQLYTIDPHPHRAAVMHAIVDLQTNQPKQAETFLKQHVARHGEEGSVMTNLAKAQSAQGQNDASLKTLWRGLELDPNQENGLGWYAVLHRESGGEGAELDAWKRVADLPRSWRAQLWLARDALKKSDLDTAMAFYAESLSRAESPCHHEQLMQISGDLGNYGHLPQILELVAPRFDIKYHGIQVGNNLLKASIDLGLLDDAYRLLQQLQTEQRPDWREALGYWENELNKARIGTTPTATKEELKVSALSIEGPLWLKKDSPVAKNFPGKDKDAPMVFVVGNSVERANPPTEVTLQPSDNEGRFCRALPLFLNEYISLNSNAQGMTQILWARNGGFVLSGAESNESLIADYARGSAETVPARAAANYAVYTHLKTSGENWTLQLKAIRTIDAKSVATYRYQFAEGAFNVVADQLLTDLQKALSEEADLQFSECELARAPTGGELDHYLFRTEQCLAVRCNTMDGIDEGFLSNPAEILDGTIHYCLQNPKHLPGRILLSRTLDGLMKKEPKLAQSFRTKIDSLQTEHPIPESAPAFEEIWDTDKD